jgi:uncharacterized membrane protein YdbT with pleckstrin-like domain
MMHYEVRRAWRAQWAALTGVVILMLLLVTAVVGWIAAYNRPELGVIARILLVLFLIGIGIVVYRHYQWKFTIDDVNIESARGIIGRNINSIRIRDLRNINLRQSLVQRLLNIGDLEFSSAGGDDVEVRFHDINDPVGTKRHVQSLLDQIGEPSTARQSRLSCAR